MKGIVYKAYCSVTNKCYIGITIKSLEYRRSQHYTKAFHQNSQFHFHRALRKYGKEAFEWSIIDQIQANGKESLIECLKVLEIKYVRLYDSYYNGYNSTKGGDSNYVESQKVKVYIETGELFRLFDNRQEAAQFFDISEDVISAGCLRKQKFSFIKGKRFIFRNENDDFTESEISELKSIKHNPYCKVEAFDTCTGNTIAIFDTIKEGAKFFGLKSASPICEILNNSSRRKTAGKYKGHKIGWRKVI